MLNYNDANPNTDNVSFTEDHEESLITLGLVLADRLERIEERIKDLENKKSDSEKHT